MMTWQRRDERTTLTEPDAPIFGSLCHVAARCKKSTFLAGVLSLLVCLFAFAEPIAAQTVALTGTVTDDSELDIRAGARIATLMGRQFR